MKIKKKSLSRLNFYFIVIFILFITSHIVSGNILRFENIGPQKIEYKPIVLGNTWSKQLTIYHDDPKTYYNVFVSTSIPENLVDVELFRYLDSQMMKKLTNDPDYSFRLKDTDDNGKTDTASWVVPELSEVSFSLQGRLEKDQVVKRIKKTEAVDRLEKELIQEKAEIGKPVRWIKKVKAVSEDLAIESIPKEAMNVAVGRKIQTIDELKTYEIEYETPAPQKEEKIIKIFIPGKKYEKSIKIKSEFSEHYENVKAYTDIPEELSEKGYKIRLYHVKDNSRVDVTDNLEYDVSFVDFDSNGFVDRVEWIVPQLSEQEFELEAFISIINVQSYPTVGGNWTVRFTTEGTADLTITTVDGTIWTNYSESGYDLKFLEIKCGKNVLDYQWINNSVFIENYECNETGYEVSKVLTPGKHTLEFKFGDDVEYAHNQAGWWNSSWRYRKQLNITNNVASILREGYSINYTLNTTDLVSAGKMMSNCSDLRIAWYNGTHNVELDRVNETSCNADATEIWFKLQYNISANGWNNSYYMYYGYSSAGSPPTNKSKVYYLWEDFEDQAHPFSDGTLNPSVTTGSKKNGNYGLYGDGTAGYRRAVKLENLDRGMIIEGWVWSGPGTANADLPGLMFGMVPATERNGYQLEIDWRSSGTSHIRKDWNSGSALDTCPYVNTNTWYYLRAIWDENSNINGIIFNDDMTVHGTLSATDSTYTSGYYGPGAYREGYWDDIKVRLYFSEEPTVTPTSEEASKIAVTLVSPSPEYETNTAITFNCSATTPSPNDLVNISLYGNWSGGWHRNQTKNITGTSNSTTFTKTISPDEVYKWNCLAFDNSSGSDASEWSNTNYTFTIDTTPPTIVIKGPNGTIADTTPTINVTFDENVSVALYNVNHSSNTTLCTGCSSVDDIYLDLAEGYHVLYIYANDSLGNMHTNSSSFTVDMNKEYYDTYDDNSSIAVYNGATWNVENVSFFGVFSGWWDENYNYRKQLNITNNGDSVLEEGYSINYTLNTSQLVEAGKLLINCNDLRIIWWNGTDNVELDRVNETACNADATEIWFKLQYNISANGWNNSYYMYYGYSSVGSPLTNKSKIYLFWDDFEDGDENGWTEHNGAWSVVSNEYYQSADDTTYLRTSNGDLSWVNYSLETKIKIASGGSTGGFAGVLFRFQDTTEHYAVILDDRPDDSFYIREWTGGSYSAFLEDVSITIDRDTWYDLKVTVLNEGADARIKVYIDGDYKNEYLDSPDGQDSGKIALMMHGTQAYYDDIKVRKYISSEPSVSALTETYKGGADSSNFTSTFINTTKNITTITLIWSESNTNATNNITVQISNDAGDLWCNATNNTEINSTSCPGFSNNNKLVYRVLFSTDSSKTITLLDMNITWVVAECNIAIGLSSYLDTNGINFGTPDPDQTTDAQGNNGGSTTNYWIEIQTSGCIPNTVDLYIKADDDLTQGSYTIPLSNFKFRNSTSDDTVPSTLTNISLTTSYTNNLIGDDLTNGEKDYLKFALSIPVSQRAGTYTNTIYFKVVKSDLTP